MPLLLFPLRPPPLSDALIAKGVHTFQRFDVPARLLADRALGLFLDAVEAMLCVVTFGAKEYDFDPEGHNLPVCCHEKVGRASLDWLGPLCLFGWVDNVPVDVVG
jgi:hypothetical protein